MEQIKQRIGQQAGWILVMLVMAVLFSKPVTVRAASAVLQESGSLTQTEEGTADAVGLIERDGRLYYRNEDGSFYRGLKAIETEGRIEYYYFTESGAAFTRGYKAVMIEGRRAYYYFGTDGKAFTQGLLRFEQDGTEYVFFFQENGTAFCDGYKEVVVDGKTEAFCFLKNGQGFRSGYKAVEQDGQRFYCFFGPDGRAVRNTMQTVTLGTRTVQFYLEEDGKAFTNGYKEISQGQSTARYYFLKNGQSYCDGYKVAVVNGNEEYYYFEPDGKAFTNGMKTIRFGENSYDYYFGSDGRALRGVWKKVDGQKRYFQPNGRLTQSDFVWDGEDLYYFDAQGNVQRNGWFTVGKGCYYAQSDGKLSRGTIVNSYRLDENGCSSLRYRILEIVSANTKPSMTQFEKIDALYEWVLHNSMVYIRNNDHLRADWNWPEGWTNDFAEQILDNNGGNCFRFACMFGYLVREATGYPVSVVHGMYRGRSPHGWINVLESDGVWYNYDVEYNKCYDPQNKWYWCRRPIGDVYGRVEKIYTNPVPCPLT